jgi:electron transfer flavoprotein-quinone oxidoreductase
MSDSYDAVIVGGGLAGLTAAYKLAQAGKSVVVMERGNYSGAKNMTGGRLYSHSLEKVIPGFADEAPLERKVTHEKISLMTEDSCFTVDFSSTQFDKPGADSYTVLRGPFDQWLAAKAEEAGAEIAYGVRVDGLIRRDGRVCGVVSDGDELEAEVTIVAEGVNSLLAQEIGYLRPPSSSQMAVSAKCLMRMSAKQVEERFQCAAGEGAAWLFLGWPTQGRVGGGFLYTNAESVSVGVVATLSDLVEGSVPVYQMLDDFMRHPTMAPLLDGAAVAEYSGHLIPEGGYKMLPKLVGDGVLLTGDAAMLCINLGYAVRGMDFAISSGDAAASATLAALESQDSSEAGLRRYVELLEDSYVLKDLKRFQKFPHFMESTGRLFDAYPKMLSKMMLGLFTVDGSPTLPVRRKLMAPVREVGLMKLAGDARKGVAAL